MLGTNWSILHTFLFWKAGFFKQTNKKELNPSEYLSLVFSICFDNSIHFFHYREEQHVGISFYRETKKSLLSLLWRRGKLERLTVLALHPPTWAFSICSSLVLEPPDPPPALRWIQLSAIWFWLLCPFSVNGRQTRGDQKLRNVSITYH